MDLAQFVNYMQQVACQEKNEHKSTQTISTNNEGCSFSFKDSFQNRMHKQLGFLALLYCIFYLFIYYLYIV